MDVIKKIFILFLTLFLACGTSDPPSDPIVIIDESSPVVWSGANQKIRKNEYLNEPYAYPICVQALDENGVPVNGVYIEYSVFTGFGGMISSVITRTNEGYDGMSINLSYISDQTFSNIIQVKHDEKTKTLSVDVIDDEENSTLTEGNHELAVYPDGVEIKGDGYDDNDEFGNSKDVYIELDYMESLEGDIYEIIGEATSILQTGGFNPIIMQGQQLKVDPDANECNVEMYSEYSDDKEGRKKMRTVLKNTRDYKNMIHGILVLSPYNC